MADIPISYPARFAPGVAVNFADSAGAAVLVSDSQPLPVALAGGDAVPPAALDGTTAIALTAGPYAALRTRPLVLTLAGTWSGTVRLLRSADGGATRHRLSLGGAPWAEFTANVCEPVWEETEDGATFYLEFAPTAGAITFRLAQ